MPRPLKQGIDYFPYDVDIDLDDKLLMIIGEFGEKGERLFIKMLVWTYKHEGYFFNFKEDVQLRFLSRYSYCGFSMSFMGEVVLRFIRWGLFDKSVFDAFHILTSVRIQETWLEATRKRKNRTFEEKIWLLGVNAALEAEETHKKAEVIHKVKESKVKESKVKEREEEPPALKNSNLFREPKIPQWEEVHRVFLQQGGSIEMAKKYFEQNEAVGWFYKSSPIVNFATQIPGYIKSWKENTNAKSNSYNTRRPARGEAGQLACLADIKKDYGIND